MIRRVSCAQIGPNIHWTHAWKNMSSSPRAPEQIPARANVPGTDWHQDWTNSSLCAWYSIRRRPCFTSDHLTGRLRTLAACLPRGTFVHFHAIALDAPPAPKCLVHNPSTFPVPMRSSTPLHELVSTTTSALLASPKSSLP